jgi:hypothetical protein
LKGREREREEEEEGGLERRLQSELATDWLW